MAVYPNNYQNAVGMNANYTNIGIQGYYQYNPQFGAATGSNRSIFFNATGAVSKTVSNPYGYGMQAILPPLTAGGISAFSTIEGSGVLTVDLLLGKDLSAALIGDGTINTTALQLLASIACALSGTSITTANIGLSAILAAALSGDSELLANLLGALQVSADLTGTSDLAVTLQTIIQLIASLTGSSELMAAIVPLLNMSADIVGDSDLAANLTPAYNLAANLAGQGDITAFMGALAFMIAAITGTGTTTANLTGLLSMESDITSTGTMLTTTNAAAAVWDVIASNFNTSGTMGAKLNSAASGGVDYDALAAAVWDKLIESGLDAKQILRILLAVNAGDATGLEGSAPVFKSVDGTTDRVTATYSNGTRTITSLDGE